MIDKIRFDEEIKKYEKNEETRIGVLNEGMLHAVIKNCISHDPSECEVRIYGKNIADVLIGDTAYEIQTESLYPMKKKLDFYFSQTELNVNVVFPITEEKYLCWVDPESGEMTKPNHSSKHRTLADYADTLIYLTEYISDPRLTLTLLHISECEYRNLDGKRSKDKKRGSTRLERVPIELISCEEYRSVSDYRSILPQKEVFTRKEYAKEKKIRSVRTLSCALKFMLALGMIVQEGKEKRELIYKVLPERMNDND